MGRGGSRESKSHQVFDYLEETERSVRRIFEDKNLRRKLKVLCVIEGQTRRTTFTSSESYVGKNRTTVVCVDVGVGEQKVKGESEVYNNLTKTSKEGNWITIYVMYSS